LPRYLNFDKQWIFQLLKRSDGLNALPSGSAGQIAATTVATPLNYLAEEAGFNVVGRLIDAVPDFELTVIATKRSWAEKTVRQWCVS
jgi:ABC-type nitrate/sulfonate/bicarbonate transport system substrate-binding protein